MHISSRDNLLISLKDVQGEQVQVRGGLGTIVHFVLPSTYAVYLQSMCDFQQHVACTAHHKRGLHYLTKISAGFGT